MKQKSTGKKISIISVAILLIIAVSLQIFGVFELLMPKYRVDQTMTRQDIENEVSQIVSSSSTAGDDIEVLTRLAYNYYYRGEFDQAEEWAAKAVSQNGKEFDAYSLLAELYYLDGRYEQSEALMLEQMALHPMNFNVRVKTQARLLKIYYQTNQYQKIGDWKALRLMGMGDFMDWMLAFDEAPYQLKWHSLQETTLPFVALDPLPVVKIEVEGTPVYAMIDTGADALILDADLAKELLASSDLTMEGSFGGGKTAQLGFMSADNVLFGDLEMVNVPVMSLPLGHISDAITSADIDGASLPADFKIGAIFGTKVFQQVVATMDYPSRQLILRDKTAFDTVTFRQSLAGDSAAASFQLAELHTLACMGELNGRAAMFWMDSGYADQSPILVDAFTFQDYGMDLPEVSYAEDAVSGGGSGYESGRMDHFGSAGIAPLIMEDVSAGYDPGEHFYWDSGFIMEAMLSHAYLRNYAWTIDFDSRMMYFD